MKVLLAGVLCLAPILNLSAADWPQIRGPGGQGIAEAASLPLTWSDSENLLWKTRLPGPGASSPIALDGKLYVTCHSGYATASGGGSMDDLKRHVLCIDAASGRILWDKTFAPKLPETEKVREHGYAAPTPATDGKHLYVFFGKSGVLKLDLSGEQIWQADVGSGIHGWGCGTSPILCDNLVIVNASVESKSLVAIDKETGREAWRAPGMDSSWNTPHIVLTSAGARELVVSVKDFILGFDPATGKELWRCEGIPDYVCPSAVSADGIVYVLGGRQSKAIAVRAGGRGDVTATHKIWQADVGANVSSPVVAGEHLFWVSDRNQKAYCLKRSNGELVYEESFGGQPYASILRSGDRLYVVTRGGKTAVLAAEPMFRELARNTLTDPTQFNASPVVAGGNLILRSDDALYCIGTAPAPKGP